MRSLLASILMFAACAADPMSDDRGPGGPGGKADGDDETEACASAAWSIEDVTPSNGFDGAPAFVLDSKDRSHLVGATPRGMLRHTTNATGAWTSTAPGSSDAGVRAPYIVLARDGEDGLHVVYANNTAGSLRGLYYQRRAPNAERWSTPVVFDRLRTSIARDLDLAVDAQGGVHVVYHAYHDDVIRYAYLAAGATSFTGRSLEASKNSFYPSVAVDHDGGVHIAYSKEQRYLKYVHRAPGRAFVEVAVESAQAPRTGVGQRTDLAVDGENRVHLAFSYRDTDVLKYATRAVDGAWTAPEVIAEPRDGVFAFALDPTTGEPHFVYEANGTSQLHYVGPAGEEILEDIAPGYQHARLRVDRSGGAHISFRDPAAGTVRYATRCP